jgi:hypothetical protein
MLRLTRSRRLRGASTTNCRGARRYYSAGPSRTGAQAQVISDRLSQCKRDQVLQHNILCLFRELCHGKPNPSILHQACSPAVSFPVVPNLNAESVVFPPGKEPYQIEVPASSCGKITREFELKSQTKVCVQCKTLNTLS